MAKQRPSRPHIVDFRDMFYHWHAVADRWEHIIGQVLTVPPANQAMPGRPVYISHTGERAV